MKTATSTFVFESSVANPPWYSVSIQMATELHQPATHFSACFSPHQNPQDPRCRTVHSCSFPKRSTLLSSKQPWSATLHKTPPRSRFLGLLRHGRGTVGPGYLLGQASRCSRFPTITPFANVPFSILSQDAIYSPGMFTRFC